MGEILNKKSESNEKFKIRVMQRSEIDLAIDWAAREGWNPGLYDAHCFYSADQKGFLIGLLGDEPIAIISVVKYGITFAFLGFYIVKPECRGKGYGIKIWDAGMNSLVGRTVGLDGVVAQQDNYKKSGFKLAYRNIRFEGISKKTSQLPPDIIPLSLIPFEELYEYDKHFFPDNRKNFLKCWVNQPESWAFAIKQDDELKGYGVIRLCRKGYKIGPLFADTADLAEKLYSSLTSSVPHGSAIFIDTPEVNSDAVDLAKSNGMNLSFETARMYRGEFPNLPINKIFSVTSFELG